MRNIKRLVESQNHRCCYCTHEVIILRRKRFLTVPPNAATRDHIEPRVYGGGGSNFAAACFQCNTLRDDTEAIAFYNLLQKWFRRIDGLHENWHSLSKAALLDLRKLRLESQERQLQGLGVRNIEFAFRHHRLVTKYGYQLPSYSHEL